MFSLRTVSHALGLPVPWECVLAGTVAEGGGGNDGGRGAMPGLELGMGGTVVEGGGGNDGGKAAMSGLEVGKDAAAAAL